MLQKIKKAYRDAWLGDIRDKDSIAQEWTDRALIFLVPLLVTGQIFLYCLAVIGLALSIVVAVAVIIVFIFFTAATISDLPEPPSDNKDKEN